MVIAGIEIVDGDSLCRMAGKLGAELGYSEADVDSYDGDPTPPAAPAALLVLCRECDATGVKRYRTGGYRMTHQRVVHCQPPEVHRGGFFARHHDVSPGRLPR
jgi:hypothetical protein